MNQLKPSTVYTPIRYKKGEQRPDKDGEYIVTYFEDPYHVVKNAGLLKYEKEEGGFVAEHDDFYKLHWLKEQSLYTFTKEELEEFGRNCFNAARKQVDGDYESGQRDMLVQVDKFKNYKEYIKQLLP